MEQQQDFTSIDDLPVNPQKSGTQPPIVVDPVNHDNQNQALQNSLEFPEDFKTDLNNIVIDKQATPTYSNEKENINNEKKVRFNIPEKMQSFDSSSQMESLYVDSLSNSYRNMSPLLQYAILSSILYFIFLNPLVKQTLLKSIDKIGLLPLTSNDGNLNLIGKIFFSFVFGCSLMMIVQMIHSSSLQLVI